MDRAKNNCRVISKSFIALLLVITLLALLSGCANFNHYNHHLQLKQKGALRIASYNINWGESNVTIKNPKNNINAIIATRADIVLLQETTPLWKREIEKSSILKKRYPYRIFRHYERAGGLAVLSKHPIKTTHYQHPNIGWHPIWIFTSQTPLGRLQFVNVHLTPPLVTEGNIGILGSALFSSQPVRKREMMFIYKQLDHKLPTIIAGDFNEGDIGRAVKLLRKNSFIDAFKQNGVRALTWETRVGPLHFFDRFDRVFYTPSLHLISLQVLHEGESDHYPVVADFKK